MTNLTEGQKLLTISIFGSLAALTGFIVPGDFGQAMVFIGSTFAAVSFCVLLVRLVGIFERSHSTDAPAGSSE